MLGNREDAFAVLEDHLSRLDPVPPSVSYYDPYSEQIVTLEQADTVMKIPVAVSGTRLILNLLEIPRPLRALHRRLIVWAMTRHAPTYLANLHSGLCRLLEVLGADAFLYPFALDRQGLRDYWHREVLPFLKGYPHSYRGGKTFLRFLCDQGLGSLTKNDVDFVRSFRGPPGNLYKSIEIGEVFLSLSEQGAIIRYLDGMASALRAGKTVSANDLREAAVLICAKKHAMRPIQISKVLPDDIRIRTSPNLRGGLTVHVRFHMAKQRSEAKKFPMLRKISSDWTPIFQEYHGRRSECDPSPIYRQHYIHTVTHEESLTPEFTAGSYFRLTPAEISQCVKVVSKKILGHSRSCNDYRHTAAQRMVDAGASHEELAAFLGQSSARTGNVYFKGSRDIAKRVNEALGLSPVFRRIDDLYSGRSIAQSELEAGPADKQISGTVHGTPIPLIGECEAGVGKCPKYPVVACYGCYKFVPIRRADRHQKVADVLRPVVRQFFDKSPDGNGSSPFGQLRATLEAVEAIIDEMKNKQ
ncbi:hypothetical protein LB545_01245 [Mesorhizobium sp. BR1-1-6]|uniref:hypothetical protein n=1 Tax=Mesorhizobium sp. BR1-1-6 TaxID=2876648 RepID=UPI001CD04FC6|nr:hypothetical protein [Mesorhizobium sp. BR1-1-6]MBZ9892950.1 hypothetical protein [Mesorhizobium sp. BR1-1-6]